jgi:DNA modification methylase
VDWMVRIGEAGKRLAELPDESVHCVVTSPPYFGLRDYGTGEWRGGDPGCAHIKGEIRRGLGLAKSPHSQRGGSKKIQTVDSVGYARVCGKCGAERVDEQIGLEDTPDEYVEKLVEVFREVRRVLRADGTVWLNVGDSYSSHGGQRGDGKGPGLGGTPQHMRGLPEGHRLRATGYKKKDLMGMPWLLAFALRADGWWLRSDIVWHKPNPLPESVTDRPTKSHEYVFLLTKSGDPTYWTHEDGRGARTKPEADYRWVDRLTGEQLELAPDGWRTIKLDDGRRRWRRINLWRGFDYFYDSGAIREEDKGADHARTVLHKPERSGGIMPPHRGLRTVAGRDGLGANKRSVWTIATRGFAKAHFATFPPKLVEPCVLAGTSPTACGICGAPWQRVTTTSYENAGRTSNGPRSLERRRADDGTAGFERRLEKRMETVGWQPTCEHRDGSAKCIVLDPFAGAATTLLVAVQLGRRAYGIELKPEYAEMARERLREELGNSGVNDAPREKTEQSVATVV